jgi:hypothetical protein
MVFGKRKGISLEWNLNNYSNNISVPHTKIPKPEILRSVPGRDGPATSARFPQPFEIDGDYGGGPRFPFGKAS